MGDVLLALLALAGWCSVCRPAAICLLLFTLSGLYLFVGIAVGICLATVCRSQQQVMLNGLFLPIHPADEFRPPGRLLDQSIRLLVRCFSWLNLLAPLSSAISARVVPRFRPGRPCLDPMPWPCW